MKTKLYLDTSVPSAYYDTSKPMRQLITQKWFENEAQLYDIFISVLTIEEIDMLDNPTKRENIKGLILKYNVDILQISDNSKLNYPLIEIGSLELFGGAQYGNL